MQSFLNKYLTVCYNYDDNGNKNTINVRWSRDTQEFTLRTLNIQCKCLHFVNHKYVIASNTESLTLENSSLLDLESNTISTSIFHKNNEILYCFRDSDQYIYINLNKNILLEMEHDILYSSLSIGADTIIEDVSNDIFDDLEKILDIASNNCVIGTPLELCGSISSNEFEQYPEEKEFAENSESDDIKELHISESNVNILLNEPGFQNTLKSLFNEPELQNKVNSLLNDTGFHNKVHSLLNEPELQNKLKSFLNESGYQNKVNSLLNEDVFRDTEVVGSMDPTTIMNNDVFQNIVEAMFKDPGWNDFRDSCEKYLNRSTCTEDDNQNELNKLD